MKLDGRGHQALALWAADCAGRVLPYFEEERPQDKRPRTAGEEGLVWARGQIKAGEARAAEYAARAVAYTRSPAALDAAVAAERDRRYRRLPEHLHSVAFSAR